MKKEFLEKNFLFSQDLSIDENLIISKELKKVVPNLFILNDELDKNRKKILYKLLKEIDKKVSEGSIVREYFKKYKNYLIKDNIKKLEKVDYFIVIGNSEFSEFFLKEIKKKFFDIKMILFLWDKLEYSTWKKNIKYFDIIFSFDRIDAKRNGFIFRPTFFINECLNNIPRTKKYNFYYIGMLREMKRYNYLLEIENYLRKLNINTFLKLYVRKKKLKELPKNYNKELIITKKISYLENIEMMKNSKVVLDIKYKDQDGLSLRVFEALATNTKIITDNEDIKNYDFYDKKNIKIIKKISDIKNIEKEFFFTSPEKISENIKQKYSVDGFINEILDKIYKEYECGKN